MNTANVTLEYGGPPPFEDKTKIVLYDLAGEPIPEPAKRDWMLISGVTIMDNGVDFEFGKTTPEMGSFLKLGVEVVPDTGFFANVLGGVTFIHWSSRWGEGTEWYGLLGGGATYFINDKDVCILAAYDNRRGFSVGVGFRF